MPFPLLLKVTLYLLVLDAFAAVHLSEVLSWPAQVLIVLAMGMGWWAEGIGGRIPNYRRLWGTLTAVFLGFAVLDLLILAESFVAAIIHLLIFLQLYKLYNLHTNRDLLDLFMLTFLQLIAACTLTVSFGFLLVFFLYMILGTWGLILLHLKSETDAALPMQSRDLLAAPDLITGGLLLSSIGLAIVSLLLTFAIFFVIPRIGRTYLPLRAQFGTLTTGFTDRVELGAYGAIQSDPTIVMRISFPEGPADPARLPDLRWRGMAFDRFDGRGWALRDPARSPARRMREGAFALAPYPWGAPLLSYEVFLDPIGTDVLFGTPRLLTIQGPFAGLQVDAGDAVSVLSPLTTRIRYQAVSRIERYPETALRRPVTPGEYPPAIRKTFLQLPPLSPRLRALADTLATGATSPLEVANRVESYLAENIQYSLELRRETDLDPLDEFLFERKAGNCEYFAASMAVLLRAAGIPARVVNGFQRGEWNEVGQYLAVRQRDAHSWVEAYVPRVGWVSFDPTPRAAFEAQAFGASGPLGKYFDALLMHWNRYVIDFTLGDQASMATAVRQQSLSLRRTLARVWGLWSFRAWRTLHRLWRPYGYLLACGLALLVALLILRRRARPVVGRHFWALPGLRRGPSVAFYARMLRLLARRGHRWSSAMTPREFATSLAGRPPLFQPVAELTTLYERVRFGGEELPAADRERAEALLHRLAEAARTA
jgi:protein-glutamine gamma-glutamyltransferase